MSPFNRRDGESAERHAVRIRVALPRWPEDVLLQWPIENYNQHYYGHLYERLTFVEETWELSQVPGGEAFWNHWNCDAMRQNFDAGVPMGKYMLEHGTWPRSPIFLRSVISPEPIPSTGEDMKVPLHLLEGHIRLTFLTELRARRKAASHHRVWVATLDPLSHVSPVTPDL